ncbi:hypothetical protein PGTUg99_019142 [Puccinia graminis f. sp. tritici]|uniref:Uncharacterized protein n=1 Tax=Puccinia graminis f. sp. tritici TaxID=56615 RepID=A0A5B0SDY5_PUCGR|nr:hypothetical protein PGTUg99_019142 [Puccinia graminis f. sp. tritici]
MRSPFPNILHADPLQRYHSGPPIGALDDPPHVPPEEFGRMILGQPSTLTAPKLPQGIHQLVDPIDQLWEHMNHCLVLHSQVGLTRAASREYAGLILSVLNKSQAIMLDNVEQINDFKLAEYEEFASDFLTKMKASWTLLQDRARFVQSQVTSQADLLRQRLAEISVHFLAALERQKLISGPRLSELINDPHEDNMLFRYIIQKAGPVNNLSKVYLNFDLKLSLQNSHFTEDIHDLLKNLNEATWQNLRRLYLGAQLKIFETSTLGEVGKQFLHYTSPTKLAEGLEGPSHASPKEWFLVTLLPQVFLPLSPSFDMNEELVKSKLLHGMIAFMIQYHVKDVMETLKKSPTYRQLQAFDIATLFLSDAFKTVYREFGEALKKVPQDFSFKAEPAFWTNINKDDQALFLPWETKVSSDRFVGFGNPSYRLAALLPPPHFGVELLKEWPGRMLEANLEALQYATPPIVTLLEHKSQLIAIKFAIHRHIVDIKMREISSKEAEEREILSESSSAAETSERNRSKGRSGKGKLQRKLAREIEDIQRAARETREKEATARQIAQWEKSSKESAARDTVERMLSILQPE